MFLTRITAVAALALSLIAAPVYARNLDAGTYELIEFAEELGVTNKVVTNWMQKHWTNGQHYKVIGKQTLINVGEAKKWLREYGTKSQI